MPAPTPSRDRWREAAAFFPANRDQRCLVGVSGGRDSVALLHLLLEHGYRRLIVCHLDHGLREESAEDARFVAALARQHDLSFETTRADVTALARAGKQSLETAGRAARHAFFATVAHRQRCWTLLLGHHADDRVETLLFNLLRGTGITGLGALRPATWRWVAPDDAAPGCALQILRPLLGIWRAEINAYLAERHLTWREDASNRDSAHTRNRLRAEALPMLEKLIGRDVKPALWRSADLLAAEDRWLRDLTQPDIEALPSELPTAALRLQPVALQRRVLRAWLRAHGIPHVGYREVEAVRALLTPTPGKSAKNNLPGDRHARRRAGVLFVD